MLRSNRTDAPDRNPSSPCSSGITAIASPLAMDRAPSDDRAFERFASVCAFIAGAGGLAYAIAFATILRGAGTRAQAASALFLLLGGVLTTAVLVAGYRRLRMTSPSFAAWGFVVGIVAAIGSAGPRGVGFPDPGPPPHPPPPGPPQPRRPPRP